MHEVPDAYIVPEQLPGMLETTTELSGYVAIVGNPPLRGIRLGKTLPREIYTSRSEPSREPQERSRIIIWRAIGPTTRPSGWWYSPLEVNLKRATGFTKLAAEYTRCWSDTAKRDLRHARERNVRVEEVPYTIFAEHIPQRGKFRKLYSFMSWQAARFNAVYPQQMRYYLAYSADGRLAAGLGVLYLPEHNFSMSGVSYSIREADERTAPVALRDRWHRDALALGITYLDWNALWRKGDARSWRGFGKFKEKFGPTIVYLPPTYITFVPSKQLALTLARLRRLFQ